MLWQAGRLHHKLIGRLIVSFAAMVMCISAASACVLASPVLVDDAGLHVRPASKELLDQAQLSIDKIQSRAERLSNRAAKGDDLKGKSESVRKEIVELYRMVHALTVTGDELLLLGERDGELLRQRANQLIAPLDATVTSLRPFLGSPPGLINAAARRAKDQLGAIKQLDELIKRQKWTEAHQKLEDLLEAADEVGRFPERSEAEPLFRPLFDRLPEVRAGYLKEKKPTVVPALRNEFAASRPDLEQLRQQLVAVGNAAREMRELRWNDQPIDGPALVTRLADLWAPTDESVLKACAILHAIGPTAEPELRLLQSDYEAVRVEAATLVRELILADTRSCDGPAASERYLAYLSAIPRFMTALSIAPERILSATAALNQLAAKSPEMETNVRAYRAATSEALRWRRRVAARYRQKFHEQVPAEPLAALIDHPPGRPGEKTGAPVLPGQQSPAEQRRFTQMAWTIEQSPQWVAAQWSEQWKDTSARVTPLFIRWESNGELTFISNWHARAVAEVECSRQTLVDCIDRLTKDLLLAPNRPPITLEAALAVQTAAHGPYVELGGRLSGAVVDNIPDRLFDSHQSSDVTGAMTSGSLVAYPLMPGLVRLQFEPDWFSHDLFAEYTGAPLAKSESQAPSAPPESPHQPPVASTSPDPSPAASPNAPTATPPANVGPPANGAAGSTPSDSSKAPAKKQPGAKPPEGGFKF
jgi:hypothetical protein